MKALIISALLFFSLRAMSAEVGESLAPRTCLETVQTAKREAKEVTPVVTSPEQDIKSQSVSQ